MKAKAEMCSDYLDREAQRRPTSGCAPPPKGRSLAQIGRPPADPPGDIQPMRTIFIAIGALVGLVSTANAQLELKNDGFESGDTADFQSGFARGPQVRAWAAFLATDRNGIASLSPEQNESSPVRQLARELQGSGAAGERHHEGAELGVERSRWRRSDVVGCESRHVDADCS